MGPYSGSGVPALTARFLGLFSATTLVLLSACGGGGATGGSGGFHADGGPGSGGMAMGVGGARADAGVGGATGTGGSGATDGGADDGAPDGAIDAGANNGTACTDNSECASGYCVDHVCCSSLCAVSCYTCASTSSPGICAPAGRGTDPHNDCEDRGATLCQTNGFCDGTGSCGLYPAGTVCNTVTPACDTTNTAITGPDLCDGIGTCAHSLISCGGFRCSNNACETSCASDATCAPGAFCGGGGCYGRPFNLAGNGDLEYGIVNPWFGFAGAGAATLSSPGTGIAHGGQYSVSVGGRTQNYQGPAYNIPSGPGQYIISFWAQQQVDDVLTGVAQIQLTCSSGTAQYLTVQTAGFGIAMPMGTWTQFSGTVDTSAAGMPAECDPTATPPGMVTRAMLYLNQTAAGTPTATPDFFADDLVVQVTDGHNLIGNPNFETGVTTGWAVAGTGTAAVSSTIFNPGGAMSMGVTGRTTSTSGPSYPLPIGGARYVVTFHALHTGTTPHDLVLQPSYTCLGGAPTTTAPIETVAAVAGNTWTTLTGMVTLPPLNATAGCKLVAAEVHVEQETGDCATIGCPDIYIDDASITIAP
ncbi:MAG TPA: carbohydrate binding domain-containing protein [Polyangia bacterium]|jgi:hypothetical protein|nr:carbohydrate binding domain-containing protein [Polyangia bacterium]